MALAAVFVRTRRAELQRYAVRQHIRGVLHSGTLQQRFLVEHRERARQHRGRVRARVHPDRVLRAGLDAEAADDAAELVDLEADRILFDRLIFVFAGLDIDALRGAGGRAHVAGDAARTAVGTRGQTVHAAVAGRVWLALFGIVDRGDEVHAGAVAVHHLGIRIAETEEVAPEVAGDDSHSLDRFAQVEALAEGEIALRPRAAALVVSCVVWDRHVEHCGADAPKALPITIQRPSRLTQKSISDPFLLLSLPSLVAIWAKSAVTTAASPFTRTTMLQNLTAWKVDLPSRIFCIQACLVMSAPSGPWATYSSAMNRPNASALPAIAAPTHACTAATNAPFSGFSPATATERLSCATAAACCPHAPRLALRANTIAVVRISTSTVSAPLMHARQRWCWSDCLAR